MASRRHEDVVWAELWWCDTSVCGGRIDFPSLHVNANMSLTLSLPLMYMYRIYETFQHHGKGSWHASTVLQSLSPTFLKSGLRKWFISTSYDYGNIFHSNWSFCANIYYRSHGAGDNEHLLAKGKQRIVDDWHGLSSSCQVYSKASNV